MGRNKVDKKMAKIMVSIGEDQLNELKQMETDGIINKDRRSPIISEGLTIRIEQIKKDKTDIQRKKP